MKAAFLIMGYLKQLFVSYLADDSTHLEIKGGELIVYDRVTFERDADLSILLYALEPRDMITYK